MTRRKLDIYVGDEDGPLPRRYAKIDPLLIIANAHTHLCSTCARQFYCWCWQPERQITSKCLGCLHEESLPKVLWQGEPGERYATSRLFSGIQVSQGGWASKWVTTRELRAALRRWVDQAYKASPPEVTGSAGAYQCGGCRFFLALDGDYGICSNPASRYDGRVVFEHVGCEANPHYIETHPMKAA